MIRRLLLGLVIVGLFGCGRRDPSTSPRIDFYATELFKQAQLDVVFPDSKTLPDCLPNVSMSEMMMRYGRAHLQTNFNVKNFILRNFKLPETPGTGFTSDTSVTMKEHILKLWPVLTRTPDQYNPNSSLIPLPYPYVVPGGRFSEVYYWDSYFTMLGLMLSNDKEMVRNMIANFSYLIDSIGHIPNGNRNYYTSRSQPPFYALMVELARGTDSTYLAEHLPELLKEYNFWMDGEVSIGPDEPTHRRVVYLDSGVVLNRYFDDRMSPRPEAYKEDYRLVTNNYLDHSKYTDLRAAAESGWDFSSRWLEDGKNLISIHTTEIIPVDLNCLLYYLERTIAHAHRINKNFGLADEYDGYANNRKSAIIKYLWNQDEKFFMDYDFQTRHSTPVKSLAGVYPLFFSIATKSQAQSTATALEDQFLKPGGWVTTLTETHQQWDSPNGWAPLQWMTYMGLKNYNFNDLAREGAQRWIFLNKKVYKATGKMVEKYNVLDVELTAGGGEYPLQDGFGWTNGVDLALLHELE